MSIAPTNLKSPLTGTVVAGRYTVGEILSGGSLGDVYDAHREVMEQRIALRVLAGRYVGTPTQTRFIDAIQRAARVEHPCINPVFDVGVLPDGRAFVAMQFAEGVSLESLLANAGGRLEPSRALAILREIAGALGAAHRQGVTHGRLTMRRVIVNARRGGRDTLTLLGFGNPVTCDSTDTAATDDVAALGRLFWQLLTGLVWVPGSDGKPQWPTRTGHIRPPIRELVARILHPDPAERPANGSAVIGSIQLAQAALSERRATPQTLNTLPPLSTPSPERSGPRGSQQGLRETPHKQVSQPRMQDFVRSEKGDRAESVESRTYAAQRAIPTAALRSRQLTPVHARPRAQRPITRGQLLRPTGQTATALVSAAGPSGMITTVLASGPDLSLGATVHLTLKHDSTTFRLSARIVKVSADGPRGPLVLTLVLDPRDEDYALYTTIYPQWLK